MKADDVTRLEKFAMPAVACVHSRRSVDVDVANGALVPDLCLSPVWMLSNIAVTWR